MIHDAQPHFLPYGRPCLDLHGERQTQWRAVGLEAGIDPVALVLHLEQVAGKLHFGPHAGGHFMGQPRQVVQPLHGLLGGDRVGETEFLFGAVGIARPARSSGALADGMQHAKADPVAAEGALRFALERKSNAPIVRATDIGTPDEVDFPFAVRARIADMETRIGYLDFQIRNHPGHRVPVVVAHGGVNAPDDLAFAPFHITKVARIEEQRERSGP